MELAQELDHLVLGRSVVTEARGGDLPELLDRAPPVHEANDEMGSRGEPMKALRREILEDVPRLPAILVTVDLGVAAEARRQSRHPVPGGTEE